MSLSASGSDVCTEYRSRRRVSIKIRLDSLSHNLKKVRQYAPHSQVMAVIKANAYGHGLIAVARQLTGHADASADLLAVAMPEEAYALREAGISTPIIVLHGFRDEQELKNFSRLNISTTVHQRKQLDILLASGSGSGNGSRLDKAIDVWLKVDTGMHRLGISGDDVDEYFGLLRNCSSVAGVSVMSHFANADAEGNALNNMQLDNFIKVTNDIDVSCSMANSAAIIAMPKSHFEVVRPGIMLYGSSPFTDTSAAELGLQSVMQFESFVLDIKHIKAGESIGYGSTYTCEKDMKVGLVAAGYGDGYPRHAENGTPIWLNGRCCELLGRVSMDSLCIDLNDIDAAIGDRVVLWGDELSVDEVARTSTTIGYELLCNAGMCNTVAPDS